MCVNWHQIVFKIGYEPLVPGYYFVLWNSNCNITNVPKPNRTSQFVRCNFFSC